MKAITSILFIFIFALGSYANEDSLLISLKNIESINDLDYVIEQHELKSGRKIIRTIENSYRQIIISFNQNSKIYYLANIVALDDNIIYGKLFFINDKFDWHSNLKPIETFIEDKISIKVLVQTHNKLYKSNYTNRRYLKELNNFYEYSFGCGRICSFKPKEAKKMLKFVEKKAIHKIEKWLRSPNHELKAYGIAGFHLLVKEGNVISIENKNLIDWILSTDKVIFNCSCCLGGLETPINELIENTKWEFEHRYNNK